MTPDQMISLAGVLVACVGACVGGYAAIKADLAKTRERATVALARADSAHERIDNLWRQT